MNKEETNPEVSDEDIYAAMKAVPGYLDITPGDFKDVYILAYRHAMNRIIGSIKAKDVMTRKVLSVMNETPVADVAELMAENGISGVPVIGADNIVTGVISEKDFIAGFGEKKIKTIMGIIASCLKSEGCMALSISARTAGEIMTSPAITVSEDASIAGIARVFNEKNINRVPVVDAGGRLSGIVSRADIVRYMPGPAAR